MLDVGDALARFEDIHLLKSRRMLATTLACAILLWAMQFRDGFAGLTISRKDTLVDDGGQNSSWNSLHGKIRFMHDRLPEFLKYPLEFTSMKIANPKRDSYIIGESGNVTDAGRSGAFTVAFMDEAAKLPWSEGLFGSIRPNCKAIWMVSTPSGKQGVFYRIHKAAQTRFNRIRLPWQLHPRRDDAWYKAQCVDMTPEQVAEEFDMSFEKSIAGRCFPEFSYERRVRDDITYDFQLPLGAGWDFGIAAPTATVFSQRNGSFWRVPMSLQRADVNAAQFAELATGAVRQMGYEGTTKSIQCWGDPAGASRSIETGRALFSAYRDFGWDIRPADEMRSPSEWIRKIRIAMGNDHWFCHPSNRELIDCFENMVYPTNPDGHVLNSELPDPKKHEFTHLPAAHGYHLGSVVCEGAYRGGAIHIPGV